MSASEPTTSIQRFSRKNGESAKDGPLSTGLEMIAGALLGLRSLTPMIPAAGSQFDLALLAEPLDLVQHWCAQKSTSPAITISARNRSRGSQTR